MMAKRKNSSNKAAIAAFMASALLLLPPPAFGQAAIAASAEAPLIEYYGELGCAHCDSFKASALPAAELASGVQVRLELYDILSAEGYKRCESRLAELGYEFKVFPVLILGNSAYQGNAAIEAQLLPELKHYAEFGAFRARLAGLPASGGASAEAATAPGTPLGSAMRWAALPIFLAGLVDGINPCAFTTLLFFMSYLGLRGGGKRRMALAGLAFAAGVFISYFLLGLGLFNVLRLGGRLTALRLALKLIMSGLTALFCALSIRDIVLYKRGKPMDMALKLPDALRARIQGSIREGLRSTAFYSGLMVTGAAVALLELACTGQVYFPAIAVMVQADASWLGMGSLLLYNLAFITPLLAVLALALIGVSQESVRSYFSRHIALSKALVAGLFAALSVAVWLF
jgi:cytochrome c biogenesis protein CcdA